jgi:hypothetical protein
MGLLIFISLFKILVVLYVFGQLRGRPETVIVPILGLIYCSLSSGFIYRNFQDFNLLLVLNDLDTQVKLSMIQITVGIKEISGH